MSTKERLDARRLRVARRTQLAPRAVVRILVLAPAQPLRAVAKAVALHLVVPDLDDELRPDGRLLELARPPAVRLGEASLLRSLQQRQYARGDLFPARRGDRTRADVVEAPVVAVQPEQERRDLLLRARLPAQAHDDGIGGLLLLHLDDALARAGQVRDAE